MGDILHGLPAVTALRQQMPRCFIGWAVEPRWEPLLGPPLVDRLHPVPTRDWKRRPFSLQTLRQIADLRRELRAERYDLCVDLQGSIRSAAIGRMAGAPRFIGPAQPREQPARLFYRQPVQLQAAHVIDHACELLSAGVGLRLQPAHVELPTNIAAEHWLHGLGLQEAQEGFVLLTPGAGWGAKQWGAENYAQVASALSARGFKVLINTGTPFAHATEAISPAAHAAARQVACSVAELISLTRRAALVIGGDTGPVHLAAALARPVVALFGPTDPRRNGPAFPGARVTVLRHPSSTLSHKRLRQTEPGLSKLTVNEVLEAALATLANLPAESATMYQRENDHG